MCTVSYVPLAAGGFILSSNRDERMSRSNTLLPEAYPAGDDRHFFPRDEESSGTWIACSASGRTYCLLNGAFENHISSPPYRKSRGLVLLELLSAPRAEVYLLKEPLEGIEPFTLIMVSEKKEEPRLRELRWDGKRPFMKDLDSAAAHIWSSATLYDVQTRADREHWFQQWLLENPEPGQEEILLFHRFGGHGDGENDLVMQRRNDRQTISITSVLSDGVRKEMCYEDLIQGKKHRIEVR